MGVSCASPWGPGELAAVTGGGQPEGALLFHLPTYWRPISLLNKLASRWLPRGSPKDKARGAEPSCPCQPQAALPASAGAARTGACWGRCWGSGRLSHQAPCSGPNPRRACLTQTQLRGPPVTARSLLPINRSLCFCSSSCAWRHCCAWLMGLKAHVECAISIPRSVMRGTWGNDWRCGSHREKSLEH